MDKASSAHVASFAPQVGAGCRVLVLGTVPSRRSLELQQSYGHKQNLFWPFMGELFDAGPEKPYAERIALLNARGLGIWDVYKSVERPGSLDASIVRDSEIPNEIANLLRGHADICAIALNGGKAAEGFRRHIAPTLNDPALPIGRAVDILLLPSTSPANASMSRAEKFRRWQALCSYASEPGRDLNERRGAIDST